MIAIAEAEKLGEPKKGKTDTRLEYQWMKLLSSPPKEKVRRSSKRERMNEGGEGRGRKE